MCCRTELYVRLRAPRLLILTPTTPIALDSRQHNNNKLVIPYCCLPCPSFTFLPYPELTHFLSALASVHIHVHFIATLSTYSCFTFGQFALLWVSNPDTPDISTTMSTDLPFNVHVSKHPLLRAKLSLLRSSSTSARDTKALINDIATILAVEALASGLDAEADGTGTSPLGYEYPVETVVPQRISVMPILRSGLAMVDGKS